MSAHRIPQPRQPIEVGSGMAGPVRVRVAGDLFHARVPAGAVYVGRQAPGLARSRFANPHRVGECRACGRPHDQADAVAAFASYLDSRPDLVAAARRELAGRDLACWCRPGVLCHADVLLARVNNRPADGTATADCAADELDGECPVCGAVYGIDASHQIPDHRIPPAIGRPVCVGSGRPAVRIRPRPYFFVEGVRWA